MAKARNLVICFDAFGTLFKIKQPIEQQYGDIARRQFGLDDPGMTDDQLRASFRAAFKTASRQHPNYGHTSNMGATAWWTSVINDTFRPFAGDLPRGLAPRLIERFASSEAYTMAPQLTTLLRELQLQKRYDQIVVGVITNSDDRVPDILMSMGLRVRPLRYGQSQDQDQDQDDQLLDGQDPEGLGKLTEQNEASIGQSSHPNPNAENDIDFHCMSYDVGVEKPDPRIFRAAEGLLPVVLASKQKRNIKGLHAALQQSIGHKGSHDTPPFSLKDWDRMYVGDEWEKDVVGAQTAGWFPVLLQDEGERSQNDNTRGIQLLTQLPPQTVGELAKQYVVVGIDSIASLLEWLKR
ncbi:haloacid dehalogenase [Ophiostoma piceae UAMH 11346]|uniref:Haloacid dehalogenase n=1 Tax=Ophiostoma piceae (strain UAMH 11346) TaxID=1262450 RepID=S3C3R6_OPHP1|nr:haloacid dehalogenase [Ophiostoma piceae UAMH 11346]